MNRRKWRLMGELFGKSEEKWETYSIVEVAKVLLISEDDAKYLFNCKVFILIELVMDIEKKRKALKMVV